MTEKRGKAGGIDVKAMLAGDDEFYSNGGSGGAAGGAGSRDDRSGGCRQGRADSEPAGVSLRLLRPDADHAKSASSSSGCRRTGTAASRPSCSNGISALRRRWWRHWPRCTCKACRHAKSRRSPRNSAGTAFRRHPSARSTSDGSGSGAVCPPPADRSLSLSDPRCPLRAGARGWRHRQAGGAGRHRRRLGRSPPGARRGTGQPREPVELA